MPKSEILVPLPDLALEGSLRVDLELIYVDVVGQQLPSGGQELRQAYESRKVLIVHVRAMNGADDPAVFFYRSPWRVYRELCFSLPAKYL
jgi:hypothetical protein